MIFNYQPLVSWPFFFGILSLLTVIGFASIFFQWRKGIAPGRIGLKLLLFFGFVVCLSLAVLRPVRTLDSSEDRMLVYQDGLEKAEVNFWKDSLDIKRTVALSKYKSSSQQVVLLGEQFAKTALYPFKDRDFNWILPERHGAIRELSWKGYLRKGEVQRLSYQIFSEKDSVELGIQGTSFQEISLEKGWNSGLLEFAPAGLGKADFPMVLEQDTLANLRFFIGAALPKKYHFQLGFPSAESRTLGTWLREKGETVTEEIKLSRETFLQSGKGKDSLQVYLIDPAQLEFKSVQDAVKTGEVALIVMNVGQAAATVKRLNSLFGTDFQLEQTGQNEDRVLENGVEALPFVFQEKSDQKLLQDRSIAIQYAGNNPIVLSLISASFPLVRQGKTDVYDAVWGELFGLLEPDEPQAWKMNAPLISGISEEIQLFRKDSLPNELFWGEDTLALRQSVVNPYLATGSLRVSESGWVDLDSGFSVFAYGGEELASLQTDGLIREIKANSSLVSVTDPTPKELISPWFWMIGMLVFLGLMWLEPKVRI